MRLLLPAALLCPLGWGQMMLPAYQGVQAQTTTVPAGGGALNGFAHRLTLTAAAQPSALAGFPVWVGNVQDNALKSAANGGSVQNPNGYDIIFTLNQDCTPSSGTYWSLDGTFDGTSGKVPAHVRLDLGTSAATFYVCFGKAAINTFQSTASAVWDSYTKGRWAMGNGTTADASDSTANGNNGTLMGAVLPTAAAGQIVGALSFSNGYVNVGAGASLNITGALTLTTWINTTWGGNQTIIGGYQGSGPYPGYGFGVALPLNNGRLGFWNGVAWTQSSTNYSVTTNVWHHVAAVLSGGVLSFYVDGRGPDNVAGIAPAPSYIGIRTLGASSDGSNKFQGRIDEVRISDTARSSDWIAAEYRSGAGTLVTKGGLL
jgi:Concanavalin A-like lectin/glucanases superfamily